MSYLGYHTAIKNKQFTKAIKDAIDASRINAFQVFVRNPMQLKDVKIDEEAAHECREYVKNNNLFLVSHASYLFNFATLDKFDEKIASAMNELLSSEKIGAIGSVFHVGKHVKLTANEGIENMFRYIEAIIYNLQGIGSNSIFILETPAGCGTELLTTIQEMGKFYHRFNDRQKENLKICVDTCHIYSAGYSLHSEVEANIVIDTIENYIGWENVCVVHLNDSKKECGCRVDRHENFCVGCITSENQSGMRRFTKFCAERRIPMVLETPEENYTKDLKVIREWIE